MQPASPSTMTVPNRRLISLSLRIVGMGAWLLFEVWGFRPALPLISSITYQPSRLQANPDSLRTFESALRLMSQLRLMGQSPPIQGAKGPRGQGRALPNKSGFEGTFWAEGLLFGQLVQSLFGELSELISIAKDLQLIRSELVLFR